MTVSRKLGTYQGFCRFLRLQERSGERINSQYDDDVQQSDHSRPNAGFDLSHFAEYKGQDRCGDGNDKIESGHGKGHIVQDLAKSGLGRTRCQSPQHTQSRQESVGTDAEHVDDQTDLLTPGVVLPLFSPDQKIKSKNSGSADQKDKYPRIYTLAPPF